jgi:hypothetical protein
MLHRTLKQFHQLQKAHYQTPPSIDCPFLEEADDNQQEEKPQNEPTEISPSPGTPGEGRGEGSAPTTDSAVLQNKPTDPASVSSVAEHANPPAQQELQNEPTGLSRSDPTTPTRSTARDPSAPMLNKYPAPASACRHGGT